MGKYKCPQCGRGFGSVGEVMSHTQEVHTEEVHGVEAPRAERRLGAAAPTRSMPSAEPGPVATERARRTEFDVEKTGDDGGLIRPGAEGEAESAPEGQNTALGTIIALLVIAALVILNLLAGEE